MSPSPNKGRTFPPEPLAPHEVKALLGACPDGTLAGIRNHALLVLFWRAGLRCSEALALRPVDVDFHAGTVRILHGKGRRARTVGLDDPALAVLLVWIETRRAAGIPNDGPLFCTVRHPSGHSLCTRYVRAMMTRLGEKAGVGHRVHAHGFRHTMAVELRQEGWPIPEISRQLGHSSIATTQIYVDHLYPAEVVNRARARSWA